MIRDQIKVGSLIAIVTVVNERELKVQSIRDKQNYWEGEMGSIRALCVLRRYIIVGLLKTIALLNASAGSKV